MKFLFRIFTLILVLSSFSNSYGQSTLLSEKVTVSLLTCGTGNELYSIYGHTALRIHDPEKGIDIVYNYGSFDFTTPNFYGKFIKGDLQYFVSTSSFEEFNYSYVYDNREITEQVLNLTPAQKEKIFLELGDVLSSEKRYYTYKFIDRNCTTMVADLINSVLPEKISTKIPDTEKTYRTILYGYLNKNFYENLGINLMFGLKTDQQSEKLFLPVELQQGVSISKNNGGKLVKEEKLVYKKRATDESKSVWNNYITFLIAIIVLGLLTGKRKFQLFWLTITGLIGVFFSLVGLYSLHKEVLWNYNVFLMNPLFLLLVFFLWRNNISGTRKMVLICGICLLCYTLFISVKVQLLMMLPLITLHGLLLWQIWKKQKTQSNH
ncbi:Lnb N-terminal periplasmic domain-containing protein [Flavobacterium pedocola]